MQPLALLAVAAIAFAAIAAASAQLDNASRQDSTPVEAVRPETAVPQVTAEQAAAMWAPTCRVQCPSDTNARSAVSCQSVSADACRQIAAASPNCRADIIPANWCASRTLAAEQN